MEISAEQNEEHQEVAPIKERLVYPSGKVYHHIHLTGGINPEKRTQKLIEPFQPGDAVVFTVHDFFALYTNPRLSQAEQQSVASIRRGNMTPEALWDIAQRLSDSKGVIPLFAFEANVAVSVPGDQLEIAHFNLIHHDPMVFKKMLDHYRRREEVGRSLYLFEEEVVQMANSGLLVVYNHPEFNSEECNRRIREFHQKAGFFVEVPFLHFMSAPHEGLLKKGKVTHEDKPLATEDSQLRDIPPVLGFDYHGCNRTRFILPFNSTTDSVVPGEQIGIQQFLDKIKNGSTIVTPDMNEYRRSKTGEATRYYIDTYPIGGSSEFITGLTEPLQYRLWEIPSKIRKVFAFRQQYCLPGSRIKEDPRFNKRTLLD